MKDVYKLFLDALAANELNEFVLGSNEKYRLICQYEELPTDPDQVFDAFKNYFNETKDHNIWIKFISLKIYGNMNI